MARDVIERELTPAQARGPRFAIASPEDDGDLRRLLRENPMAGRIALTLEREPDYFADAHIPGEVKQTIIARECGHVVCAGSCTVRDRYINGCASRVGYLGGLRLDASVAGRFDIVRRGYEFFRELQADAPADFYFTSIAADNERARRLLERGLPGMPRYEFIGEFVTSVVLAARCRAKQLAQKSIANCNLDQLNEYNRAFQFAPCWSGEEMAVWRSLGLRMEDRQSSSASATLWDQRSYKQTVVRGYAPRLAWARSAVNFFGRIARGMELPAVGEKLASAFVSQLMVEPDDFRALAELVAHLRHQAMEQGIKMVIFGFAANDPRLHALRNCVRGREYHSRLYLVSWPGMGGAAKDLDARILTPEVAFL